MKYILLLLLLPTLGTVYALIGYDCGGGGLNITTLSLLDTTDCDLPESKPEIEETYVQLLQLSKFKKTKVIQCRVEIDRTVYHCGMHSHISITEGGRQAYIREVSEAECRHMQERGELNIGHNKYLTNIKRNTTTRTTATLAGSIEKDGTCEGEFFDDGYGQWTKVAVQATIKITLTIQMATVRLDENKITLQNGVTCELNKLSCFDEDGGYSFWADTPEDNCRFNEYDVLYEGTVSKIIEKPNKPTDNPMTIYSIASDDVTFALIKTTERRTCG